MFANKKDLVMKCFHISYAGIATLLVLVTPSICTATMEKAFVSEGEYQLTKYDTEKTARERALVKARKNLLRDLPVVVANTTKMTDTGNITKTGGYEYADVISEKILSANLGSCSSLNSKTEQCYKIKIKSQVNMDAVSAVELDNAMEMQLISDLW